MLTVLIFILILGLLVFVHELGHFLVARRNGVEVEEFGFGFPPRILGFYWNRKGEKKIVWGSKEIEEIREARRIGDEKTVYSINWIPLGGFVKITGEDGEPSYVPPGGTSAGREKGNPKSFASKSHFTRMRILAAGVVMNVILAIVLFSMSFYLGVPQPVEEISGGIAGEGKIQIVDVGRGTPAEAMGLRAGDEILGAGRGDNFLKFSSIGEFQNFVGENKGKEIALDIKRGKQEMTLSGTPRENFSENEGPLGIGLAEIAIARYSFFKSIYLGFQYTFSLIATFVAFLGGLIWRLIAGQPVATDVVSGPVGIAVLTGQVAQLGFNYLIRFTAMLSINLAIINILPIPALDGGRIIFILIEKFKGSPMSQRFEQRAHNIGFALLITLMLFVTIRDFARFDLVEKIKNIF